MSDWSLTLQEKPSFKIEPRTILAYSFSGSFAHKPEPIYSFRVSCVRGNLERFTWDLNKTYDEFKQLEKDSIKVGAPAGRWLPSIQELNKEETDKARLHLLSNYLLSLQLIPIFNHVGVLMEFFEVSNRSFEYHAKYKEGYVQKRSGGRIFNEKKRFNWRQYVKTFAKRWMFIAMTSTGPVLFYKDSAFSKAIKEAMPLHIGEVTTGLQETGYEDGVCINGDKRRLLFRAGTPFKALEWLKAIEKIRSAHILSFPESSYSSYRFESSFPERINVSATWLIDGSLYFETVLQDLLNAKSEVLITDWWLSPELFLRRPSQGQLCEVLSSLASSGVKVYILLYNEVSSCCYNNSLHAQQLLEKLNSNIKVVRHPNRDLAGGEYYWSHHEKSVIIDRKVGFVGGLDMCFGRWDTNQHKLFDDGENRVEKEGQEEGEEEGKEEKKAEESLQYWRGIDYSNPRVCDFSDVAAWDRITVPRNSTPRMPWHDIGLRMTGKIVLDLASHFFEVWNHAMTDFIGPYTYCKDLLGAEELLYEQRFERSETMMEVRRMATGVEKVKEAMNSSIVMRAAEERKAEKLSDGPMCNCQLLRSGCGWSLGSARTEHSIHEAYLRLIENSRHFIYIENQFFISSTAGHPVQNGIALALIERIKRARREGQNFKVIVVMPLLPAFEGKVGEAKAKMLRLQMHWQYSTINRGRTSMFGILMNECGIDPDEYIRFYGLRTWAYVPRKKGKCVSELIYVHSKLMIVDDDVVLIGSANINDRSQLGDHDSELAVVVESAEKIESQMNGRKVRVSKFAHSLRMQLFQEFSNLSQDVLRDPLSEVFQSNWIAVASSNELAYRILFNAIPDDRIGTFAELEEIEATSDDISCAADQLAKINGFLVPFPLHFLEHEDLSMRITDVEKWLLGSEVFV